MFSVINLSGLSIGFASTILLAMVVVAELSYDEHFVDNDRIYRIASQLTVPGSSNSFAKTSYALGPLFTQKLVEVENYARFQMPQNTAYELFAVDGDTSRWPQTLIADASVFDIFSHKVMFGDTATALAAPNGIAVSERFAKHYFGAENPIGKTVEGGLADYQINLVFQDLPDSTHLKYDVLISYASLPNAVFNPTLNEQTVHDLWYGRSDYTYVRTNSKPTEEAIRSASDVFFEETMASFDAGFNSSMSFYFEPLTEIHLSSVTQSDEPQGSQVSVLALIALGFFLLLVASINYTLLSTAQFTKRMKQVNIQKFLGARRVEIISRFLTESILYSLFAMIIGLVCVDIVLSFTPLNALLDMSLTLSTLRQWPAILLIGFVALLVGLIAGCYPAWFLSTRSVSTKADKLNLGVRNGLVFIQFVASVAVISCSIIMYLQLQFLYDKPLGFEKENKIVLTVYGADNIERLPVLFNQLHQISSLSGVSASRGGIGDGVAGFGQADIETNDGSFQTQSYNWFYIDENYIDTLGISLLEGRNFDPQNRPDLDNSVLVNKTLADKMGWTQAVGKSVKYDQGVITVIGVMDDFHFQGLQNQVEPIMFWLSPPPNYVGMTEPRRRNQRRTLNISYVDNSAANTLNEIRRTWESFDTEHPFEFRYLDATLDAYYATDRAQMILVVIFAGLSIFISCLGLLGLSAFIVERKTKEIGVRKVLGASAWEIIKMLFKNILFIVMSASFFAALLSAWLISYWMDSFYYKADIGVSVYIASATVCIVVAFATLTLQALATARANPIESLRVE